MIDTEQEYMDYLKEGDYMITRQEVYNVLDAERDYQDSLWSGIDPSNSVGDYLAYIQRYLTAAINEVDPTNPKGSLDNIRKITALGIACMERHGAPARNPLDQKRLSE